MINAVADSETRVPACFELDRYFGSKALPAIQEGLAHGNWLVRKWSGMFLDHYADAKRPRSKETSMMRSTSFRVFARVSRTHVRTRGCRLAAG